MDVWGRQSPEEGFRAGLGRLWVPAQPCCMGKLTQGGMGHWALEKKSEKLLSRWKILRHNFISTFVSHGSEGLQENLGSHQS